MDNLEYKRTNGYDNISESELKKVNEYAKFYSIFLNNSKTEREAVELTAHYVESCGYEKIDFNRQIRPFDNVYYNNEGKSLAIVHIGDNDIEKDGIKIIGAHIDSPRLDLKQVPLYEDDNFALLKTHYYGGIRKYQWLTIPLAMHGVICLNNGETIKIAIGEEEEDPIFYISDLLPHLGRKDDDKKIKDVFDAEKLNIICGGMSLNAKEKQGVKLNVLNILNEKYGICEADFLSAEIELVPAYKTREVGFDRAFLAGYGHDDKVCAFPAFTSLLRAEDSKTCVIFLLDKEEIGSETSSGAQSLFILDVLREIVNGLGKKEVLVRRNSKCLSADVTSAYDVDYKDVFESNNAAHINCGVCMCKFTGGGGKSGANDASAETVGYFRRIYDENNVLWQTGELGKVDIGSGGTIAKYFARHSIDTVDIGVPVISMHSPYELISKVDLYSAYMAFRTFLLN